ncbi:hypothetical protein E6H24_02750 [Candidatus Bathyarchaeota archaeon]|nr:MAG: hypothetical protein E6H24_02750 [Candidatus Bathyarchaeota archaeon]
MLAPQDSSSMGSPRLFLYRMVRAARLDGHIFTSLRDDESATGQSLLVLALAGLSFGFGLAALVGGDLIGVLVGSVAGMAVVGWTAVSSVFAVKNAMGFDAQRSLVTFIIVALAMLIIYGFLPPL